jgi:hypothetical protein
MFQTIQDMIDNVANFVGQVVGVVDSVFTGIIAPISKLFGN